MAEIRADVKNGARRRVESEMRSMGFRALPGGAFEQPLAGVPFRSGWVAFPERDDGPVFEMSVTVGIRDDRVSALMMELVAGTQFAATAAINLGLIDDQQSVWSFSDLGQIEGHVTAMLLALTTRGLPFVREMASDTSKLESFIRSYSMQADVVIPLLRIAEGNADGAMLYVENAAVQLPERGPYREFYLRLQSMIPKLERVASAYSGRTH